MNRAEEAGCFWRTTVLLGRARMQLFEPSAADNGLAEEDVRAMGRLLAEVAIAGGRFAGPKQSHMCGLQKLIGGDGWLWSITAVEAETRKPICTGLMHSGLNEDQLAGWLEASQSNCPPPEDEHCFGLTRAGKHF